MFGPSPLMDKLWSQQEQSKLVWNFYGLEEWRLVRKLNNDTYSLFFLRNIHFFFFYVWIENLIGQFHVKYDKLSHSHFASIYCAFLHNPITFQFETIKQLQYPTKFIFDTMLIESASQTRNQHNPITFQFETTKQLH